MQLNFWGISYYVLITPFPDKWLLGASPSLNQFTKLIVSFHNWKNKHQNFQKPPKNQNTKPPKSNKSSTSL